MRALWLLPLVLAFGCASVTPDGRIRTSGDANQDTVIIKGACKIESTESGAWLIECAEGGSATWTMAESANANLYVELVQAGVEAAAAGASPTP